MLPRGGTGQSACYLYCCLERSALAWAVGPARSTPPGPAPLASGPQWVAMETRSPHRSASLQRELPSTGAVSLQSSASKIRPSWLAAARPPHPGAREKRGRTLPNQRAGGPAGAPQRLGYLTLGLSPLHRGNQGWEGKNSRQRPFEFTLVYFQLGIG